MTQTNKEEYITIANLETGMPERVLKSELKNPDDWVIVKDSKGNSFAITKEDFDRETKIANNMRGCFFVFVFLLISGMMGSIAYVSIDQYKKNKKHPNVISEMYDTDKRLVISDVYTGEERMIDYKHITEESNQRDTITFEDQIKHSKIGDTVIFVAYDYEKRRSFVLGGKPKNPNSLTLNKDSIIARIAAEKLKNNKDSLVNHKEKQR